MNRKISIQHLAPQDRESWQKLYYRHKTTHRQRRRLLALKAIWDGQTMARVCREQKVHRHSLEHWLDPYLHGGFDALLAPERRAVPQTLSPQRRKVLHYILLHKSPADYGMDSYQWTSERVRNLIEQKRGVTLGLGEFNSFPINSASRTSVCTASPAKRAAFVADLKKNSRTSAGWRPRGAG